VLDLSPDIGTALATAFRRGYLDVPYCLHPDNAGRARSYLDSAGRLQWSSVGSMPIRGAVGPTDPADLTAAGLLASLSYVERTYDSASLEHEYRAAPAATHLPTPTAPPLPGASAGSTGDDRDPDPGDRSPAARQSA